MGKATGKANHPHDASRPARATTRRAIDSGDIEAVMDTLSPRQRRFCEEYVLDFNGSAAAIRAGYSTKYPDQQASILLRNAGVAAVVSHLMASKEARITSVNPEYVIQRIVKAIALAEEKEQLMAIFRGAELLARHLGMLTDKTEIKGEIDVNDKRKVDEEAENFTNLMKKLRDRTEKDKTVTIV